MIRYRYADQLNPPAPFVNVTLRCPATGTQAVGLLAQLDIAADRTVLPGRVVEALGLVEDGRALFQGFAGELIELPVFLGPIPKCQRPLTWSRRRQNGQRLGSSRLSFPSGSTAAESG